MTMTIAKEELLKACTTLRDYCNHGINCCNCLFETTCEAWVEGKLDTFPQVMNGFIADLILGRYGKELVSVKTNLITLCQNFNSCRECPFGVCDPCPKRAIERVLNDD